MKYAESMVRTGIKRKDDARLALQRGVNTIADAVGSTLGPRGQNVAIAKFIPNTGEIYERIVVHDGVTVAKSIDLPDEYENMGAQLLKEASQKQVDKVGDGTTAVMILARAIINECMGLVAAGVNPMSVREGLENQVDKLTLKLKKMAVPIKGFEEMKHIATVSSEDEDLGELVAKTLQKVGEEGVVTVEESKGPITTVEHQTGMQLDQGYLNPLFVTNPQRMEATLENTYILITDKSITTLVELASFFEEFVGTTNKNLVIISPDISGEALPLLIQNKLAGKLNTLCIKAPSFGQDQKNILQDIAIMTGGKFITEDAGYQFKDLTVDDLGFAEYVTATKSETIIVKGRGDKDEVAERVASIKKAMDEETQEFDRERMRARLGKLTNGVAVIRVGGMTEVEMKERRERVLDAVAATRAAMQEGIVAGGEIVYLHLRKFLGKDQASRILKKALYEPFKMLITNADIGEVEASAMMLLHPEPSYGIDVTDGKVKDMIQAGIVDPVLVPLYALQNALSVAIQIITTGSVIIPVKGSDDYEVKN